jgi:hypothetical protein
MNKPKLRLFLLYNVAFTIGYWFNNRSIIVYLMAIGVLNLSLILILFLVKKYISLNKS